MANNPLRVVIQGVDRLTAPIRRINQSIQSMTGPIRQTRAAMRQLAQAAGMQRLSSAFNSVRSHAAQVATQLRSIALRFGALTAAAGGAAFAMVRSMTQSGDEIAKTAARLGVGVEWLQEYRYAAERSGVETSTFDRSIQSLGRRLGEFAATGKGEAAQVIEAMGLQLRDAAGEMRPMEQLLPEIADKLTQIEDPMLRNAAASKLLGEEGVALIQMLMEGSVGMSELAAEGRSLGRVMGEDLTKRSEGFQDLLTNIQSVMLGLRNTIASALLPVFERLGEQFKAFLLDNRERVAAFAREFAERLPGYLAQAREAFLGLLDGARRLMELLQPLADRFGWLKVALVAVGAVVFGPLLAAMAGLTQALATLGVALLTTPVGWFLAAVAAIAGAVYLIYREWDAISEWFRAKFARVREAFSNGLIQGVYTLLREFNPLLLVIEAINAIVEYLTGVDLLAAGEGLIDSLWEGIRSRLDALTGWFRERIDRLRGMVPDWMIDAGGRVRDGFSAVTNTVNQVFAAPDAGAQAERSARIQAAGRNYGNMARSLNPGAAQRSEAAVDVRFHGMPPGTRVEQSRNTGVDLGLDLGYSMNP